MVPKSTRKRVPQEQLKVHRRNDPLDGPLESIAGYKWMLSPNAMVIAMLPVTEAMISVCRDLTTEPVKDRKSEVIEEKLSSFLLFHTKQMQDSIDATAPVLVSIKCDELQICEQQLLSAEVVDLHTLKANW